jgi:UDP-N-acetylmuramate: L-alanyl-gamma-D-glutamyl-meso-diaminopimelate ligase
MKIHFIAIGGAAMHSLAIALHRKGYTVTGSDDEIFEPARGNLEKTGLLPPSDGWDPERIHASLDAIILGMHAHADNPELARALELGLKVYSYPEFLYHETEGKTRVVIAGSHGKTTITSMVMHALRVNGIAFDYMAGSRLEGFDNMVGLHTDTKIAVFEGDEYLSSSIDRRPKFLLYQPQIALISGIAWDHINVFPTWENYVDQFRIFIESMPAEGYLVYCAEDEALEKLATNTNSLLEKKAYRSPVYRDHNGACVIDSGDKAYTMKVFGRHNMQNLEGARMICSRLGLADDAFYQAMMEFRGAGKRLQLLGESNTTSVYLDFAHSPSKVEATVKAVRERFPNRKVIAVLELHTYSSLNREFLSHYSHTLNAADEAVVFYSPDTIRHKRLAEISPEDVIRFFDTPGLKVFTGKGDLQTYLGEIKPGNLTLLLMSSGNFGGIDLKAIAEIAVA